ncbi:hypothetical protein ACQ86N_13335 [Puia sp. P3]
MMYCFFVVMNNVVPVVNDVFLLMMSLMTLGVMGLSHRHRRQRKQNDRE